MSYIFSVIIPSRNRMDTLIRVLRSLEIQNFRRNAFQVIVVDDASTDGTISFLKNFAKKTRMSFTWLKGKGKGAAAARNLALHRAGGKYILFLDADTIAESDMLLKHFKCQQKLHNACVVGRVTMSDMLDMQQQARLYETTLRPEVLQATELHWQEYRTANTSIKKSFLLQSGFFNEKMQAAEDTELAGRLAKIGVHFHYVDDIEVIHHHPISYKGYFTKGAVYGQAVAHWYMAAPEFRALIAARYGVFCRETVFTNKLKYAVRSLFINQLTVKNIAFWGRVFRPIWFGLSESIYTQVYRYHTRRAFRLTLAEYKIESSYADIDDKLVVHAGI